MSHVSDVTNSGRAVGENRHCGKCLSRIADRIHIDINAMQRLSSHGDAICAPGDFAAHLFQSRRESHVALQRVFGQAGDRDGTACHRCSSEEITGGRSVRFYIVNARLVWFRADMKL